MQRLSGLICILLLTACAPNPAPLPASVAPPTAAATAGPIRIQGLVRLGGVPLAGEQLEIWDPLDPDGSRHAIRFNADDAGRFDLKVSPGARLWVIGSVATERRLAAIVSTDESPPSLVLDEGTTLAAKLLVPAMVTAMRHNPAGPVRQAATRAYAASLELIRTALATESADWRRLVETWRTRPSDGRLNDALQSMLKAPDLATSLQARISAVLASGLDQAAVGSDTVLAWRFGDTVVKVTSKTIATASGTLPEDDPLTERAHRRLGNVMPGPALPPPAPQPTPRPSAPPPSGGSSGGSVSPAPTPTPGLTAEVAIDFPIGGQPAN